MELERAWIKQKVTKSWTMWTNRVWKAISVRTAELPDNSQTGHIPVKFHTTSLGNRLLIFVSLTMSLVRGKWHAQDPTPTTVTSRVLWSKIRSRRWPCVWWPNDRSTVIMVVAPEIAQSYTVLEIFFWISLSHCGAIDNLNNFSID